MSSLAWHSTSHSASGSVNASMPRNPSIASVSSISARHRTDLLASLIGVPAARRTMSAALARMAAMSTTANGASICELAALSRLSSSAVVTYGHPGTLLLFLYQRAVLRGRQQARGHLILRVEPDLE